MVDAQPLGNRLERTASFRNLLVRQDDKLDPEIVAGILSGRLGDFTEFKEAIVHHLAPA